VPVFGELERTNTASGDALWVNSHEDDQPGASPDGTPPACGSTGFAGADV